MDNGANNTRTAYDLFKSGDSVCAYEYLGAHVTKRGDVQGVLFRVWAPQAQSVSVVGDFNDWNKTSDFMKKAEEGIWELFVPGMPQYGLYKYCVETPWFEKILKSDPYAFYAEKRPDNASRVYDIDGYDWGDSEWIEKRKSTDWDREPVNIYELHAGTWKRNEDGSFYSYSLLADELAPYIKEMGYTHVQFMPIMEHPFDGSWGYQTTGYFAPTARYGTPKEFMYLVDKLHQAGIGVILDWVPSNFPKDSFALSRFDGTALYEDENPLKGERPSWDTCLFDYSKPEVVSFLISSANFWLERYHVDGIRLGALSSMLYLDYAKSREEWIPNELGGKENLEAIAFVKKLNDTVHKLHPGMIMCVEEVTSWPKLTHSVDEGGMGFDYKWNMGWMNDMLHYMTLDSKWRPFNHDNLTYSFFYAFSEHFLLPLSHDEASGGKGSLLSRMPGGNQNGFADLRAFLTYMYAHPGKKLVFMGIETGQNKEWNEETVLDWTMTEHEENEQLFTFFKELNHLYRETKPFYEMDTIWKGFDWIHHDDYTNSVIAFKRSDEEGNEIIAVCNFRPVKHEKYRIGVPIYGVYDEFFNSDDERFGGTGVSNGHRIVPEEQKIHGYSQSLALTIPPMSVMYLKCVEKLEN
ncbi:MAG: 1,4-alpha-glucan branching protein GlgB [Ruminococcus sp.]|nr:1,4-alpha-glucan branching protein GlgB [Ruminococcus sp.]